MIFPSTNHHLNNTKTEQLPIIEATAFPPTWYHHPQYIPQLLPLLSISAITTRPAKCVGVRHRRGRVERPRRHIQQKLSL